MALLDFKICCNKISVFRHIQSKGQFSGSQNWHRRGVQWDGKAGLSNGEIIIDKNLCF